LRGIPIGRREALDGAAGDPDAEAARYEAVLDTAPVDLAVLGLGRDAHVAFNEPGSRPGDDVRRVTLDPSTIAAAAAHLHPTAGRDSDHVTIVLGHREPGVSAEHRISAHSRARLARAVRPCRETPVRTVVLTGYTHTGGLSEAEQTARDWPLRDVPVLLEVAGRTTAENASRSLPIVLALGVAARVSVVTSLWHVRVPYWLPEGP
jgi:hypothetical protein